MSIKRTFLVTLAAALSALAITVGFGLIGTVAALRQKPAAILRSL